jgi:hypothetical protein
MKLIFIAIFSISNLPSLNKNIKILREVVLLLYITSQNTIYFNNIFLINFNFIFQYLVCCGLDLMIYFDLFYIKLSQSRDMDYKFDGLILLTWVFSFFLIVFFNFILQNFIDWKLSFIFL